MNISIREATKGDINAILRMASRFLDSHFAHLMTYDPIELATLVEFLLEEGVIFLAEVDAEGQSERRATTVGMLALAFQRHPLNGLTYGDELAWWVDPEWRNGMAGPKMLRHAEDYARQKGLSMLKMVAPASDPDVGRFYERRGYVPVEMAYQKILGEKDDGAIRRRSELGSHGDSGGLEKERSNGPV